MDRGLFAVFILGIVLFGLVSGEKVSVVIMEDSVKQVQGFSVLNENVEMEVTHEFSSVDGFAAEVDSQDLDKLRANFGDRVFVDDREFNVMLDVSVPQIGGNDSWGLSSSGFNINGTGQTVCIIDTGVNYSHPALGGCYGNNDPSSDCKVLGGYDYINDDDDPMDDHGHGTHVAGIAASNDSVYSGIAPDSKIIAMKVLNSTGTSESGSDILAAIDWCVANASVFNISAISMSFGDASTYNYYCDAEAGLWDDVINAAVAEGIPVIVSAGNCDQVGQTNCTIGVAFPACIESATRAGAVDDSDAIDYMRGALFQLMAPGKLIRSSLFTGGFGDNSGTSMSAPHISGSIALIKQYLNLSGQSKSVDEIESVLNDSGIRLDDSAGSGYNFTRINVYDTLLDLDIDSPNVTLVSPADNHVNLSVNHSFACNVSDWQLANVTFKIWNSSGLYYNESKNLTGTENATSFELTNLNGGDYFWNCESWDLKGNIGIASNFTLSISGIEVSLDSPANSSYTNVNETNFTCSAQSDSAYDLDNVTFYLWNSSGVLMKNETKSISGASNSTIFNYTFLTEDDYHWSCVAYNNNSDEGNGINFSVGYDATAPVVSDLSVSVTTSSAVISWTTGEAGNSSVWVSGGSWSNSSSYITSHSVSVSALSASTNYSYVVTSCDVSGNCGNDSGSFTTSAAAVVSSGGGGGGGPSAKVIDIKDEELWEGKAELLGVNDKMNFNLASGKHSLKISKVGVDFAEIVVTSDPVYLNLSVGEKVKLNLSSADYYDLIVRLNSVLNGKANVSAMRIFEMMEAEEEILNESNETEGDRVFHITEEEEKVLFDRNLLILIGTVVAGILLWSLVRNRKEVKADKVSKKNNGKQNKKAKAKAKRSR